MPTRVSLAAHQTVATRNQRVDRLDDVESEGIGVRVLVGGAWGFACDNRLRRRERPRDGPAGHGLRASGAGRSRPRARASGARPGRVPHAGRKGPLRVLARRQGRAVPAGRAGHAARRRQGDRRRSSARSASRSCSSPRTGPRSTRRSSSAAPGSTRWPQATASRRSAATPARTAARARRPAGSTSSRSRLEREAPRVGEQAAALLRADACPAGITTIVVDSEQMELQVHESVGHPTELDRVYGTEAAYAGTSFLKPHDLGSLRYGSEHMNVTADATTPGGLGTFGYDDEGVPAAERAGRRGGRPAQFPRPPARPRPGSAAGRAARCAPTAGAGCRSSA